jgi:hypothetical protein
MGRRDYSIPIIIVLTIIIFGGFYWWHTSFHCISRGTELRCHTTGTVTRCREVPVCDAWAPNEEPVTRPKRKMKAEAE